jgi:hypothetical protein
MTVYAQRIAIGETIRNYQRLTGFGITRMFFADSSNEFAEG